MLKRLRKYLHGEAVESDCVICERRTFVCHHDERRCPKGHAHFRGVPRIKLRIGK